MLSKSKKVYLGNEFNIDRTLSEEDFIRELCKKACTVERYLGNGISRMSFDLGSNLILKVNVVYGEYAAKLQSGGYSIREYLEESETDGDRLMRYSSYRADEVEDLEYDENITECKDIDTLTEYFFDMDQYYNEQTENEVLSFDTLKKDDAFAHIYGYSNNYTAIVMEKCIPFTTIEAYMRGYNYTFSQNEVKSIKSFLSDHGFEEVSTVKEYMRQVKADYVEAYDFDDLHLGNVGISFDGDFRIYDYAM